MLNGNVASWNTKSIVVENLVKTESMSLVNNHVPILTS